MTKEELEKEAEEIYLKTDKEFMDCQDEGEIFNLGYLAGAEPREKRIEDLEKENAELKEALEGYKKIAKWCDKCDKIAELKLENQKWKDEWQEQVQKANDEGYARTLQTIQLTKAKEIIRSLYFIIQGRIDYKGNIPLEDEMYRANQFLNSEVEK